MTANLNKHPSTALRVRKDKMAFNSSNTIRSRVVGQFEDHISPETDKASKRVQADMDRMAKSAKGFIAAVAGIIALREIKQIFTELINFASEHQTAVTGQINKMKAAYNAFMTGIVESPLFGQLIDRITETLSFAAVLIQNSAAWDSFLVMIRAKWNLFTYGIKQSFVEAFSFDVDMIAGMMQKNPGAIAAALAKNFDNDATTRVMVQAADQAAADFNKAFESGLKSLKVSAAVTPIDTTVIPKLERDVARLGDRYTALHFQQQAQPLIDGGLIQKQLTDAEAAALKFELAWADTMQSVAELTNEYVVGSLVSSLEFLGATMVGLGGGFDKFFAQMLGQLGDFAIRTGAIMIATGLGLKALFAFSPTAAIAAGTALVILGGALKAISSNMQKLQTGGSGTSSPAPVRDYSNRNTASSGAQVNQYNTFQILSPNSIPQSVLNELAYSLKKEITKQSNLGR